MATNQHGRQRGKGQHPNCRELHKGRGDCAADRRVSEQSYKIGHEMEDAAQCGQA